MIFQSVYGGNFRLQGSQQCLAWIFRYAALHVKSFVVRICPANVDIVLNQRICVSTRVSKCSSFKYCLIFGNDFSINREEAAFIFNETYRLYWESNQTWEGLRNIYWKKGKRENLTWVQSSVIFFFLDICSFAVG